MTGGMTDALPSGEALSAADHVLVQAARETLLLHYKPRWHMVSAAIRGRDGRIWTGIHLGATVGRMQVCAEAVALGRAILEGDGTIECAVAVRHHKPGEDVQDLAVVPPCGACREMMVDFDAGAQVIVPADGVLMRVAVRDLLPLPYRR
jgi:cytidine deaminase